MATTAAAPAGRPTLSIRGSSYPVLLPKLSDPRLHLAAVIISLQVLGQVAFDFKLSIAQILISLGTCAVLEVAIAFRQQHVILWPASALLTGNGVAFVLRVPGTQHGDWWSTNGWWIFAGTAAVSLLSKYVIKWRGSHIFNPSNFGLVLCFLVLGSDRAEPLDFWWGPMSAWMALALAIIVCGGLAILTRLKLLGIAVGFWVAFAASTAVVAASGHNMIARWHLGPITSRYFWWVLVTSPEVLVFMFFMITDPKTTPKGRVGRIVYGVGLGLLATLLMSPFQTEFQAKVALLGSLTIVCGLRPLVEWLLPAAGTKEDRLTGWIPRAAAHGRAGIARLGGIGLAAAAAFAAILFVAGIPARSYAFAAPLENTGKLPKIAILHSTGVASQLDRKTARLVARSLVDDLRGQAAALRAGDAKHADTWLCCQALTDVETRVKKRGDRVSVTTYRFDVLRMKLRAAEGQGEPIVVVHGTGQSQEAVYAPLRGKAAKLVQRSGAVPADETFQMDRGKSGYEVISFSGAKVPSPKAVGSAASLLVAKSFPGVHLQDVASKVGLDFRQDGFRYGVTPSDVHSMMGGGLCWLDYNNDGWMDLFVVNSFSDEDRDRFGGHLPTTRLYENRHGKFVDVTAQSHAGMPTQGNGCVAADLNGDGLTDLFVTTTTYNILLLNNGNGTFRNVSQSSGIDAFGTFGWHTGAAVADVNGDGRPDIFVSGYADVHAPSNSSGGFPLVYKAFPDLLYLNEGHGKFKDVAQQVGIDRGGNDHSLGAVFTDVNDDGRPDLYVANDLDPNRLYLNRKGGKLGFHFVEQGKLWGVANRGAGMGVAAADFSGDGSDDLFVTNSRSQGHAAFRSGGGFFAPWSSVFARAIGTDGTGWGDSWIDLANNGKLDLVLANGAIPVTNLKQDAGPIQVLENTGGKFADASKAVGLGSVPLVNGRGLAAADYDNDGRVDIAVNSIGGKLILLHNTGSTGHWLEVKLSHFAPGAVVTVSLPDGRKLVREVQAGSSYLSSEDPRVHFGLGDVTRVPEVTVRWPDGRHITSMSEVEADRIVTAG